MISDTENKQSDKNRLYKPTSKLAELASTFKSVKEAKRRDVDDEVRCSVIGWSENTKLLSYHVRTQD